MKELFYHLFQNLFKHKRTANNYNPIKILGLSLGFILFISSQPAFGKENATLIEGFNDTGWGSSYGDYTVNAWDLVNVFRETTKVYEGASAIRFKTSGSVKSISSPEKTSGIGTISLWHRQWSASDGDVTYQLYKSTDGINWGTALTSFTSTSESYTEFTYDINDANAKYIKIEIASTYKRSLIDYISITDYPAASTNPVIANIARTPSGTISPSDAVSISADITDSDGIGGAELHWGTTSGSLNQTINMSLSSGDTYATDSDIPSQTNGTVIYYEVYATDNNTNETSSTENSYTVQNPAAPEILISTSTLNFNNAYAGNSTAPEIYTVSGNNLTADIEITAPNGYELSTECSNNYSSSITLSQNSGTVAETKIYLRFSPSSVNTFAGNITHTSTGATTKNIAVNETNTATTLTGTYYNTATGNGRTLLNNLHDIIKGHTKKSYDDLWAEFQNTDKKPNGTVWDMYSDKMCDTDPYEFTFISEQCGGYSTEGDCYNREHSFPKSWWGGDVDTMYSDLFHLVPTDGKVNGQRSSYEFGIVNSPTWTSLNGSKLGANTYSGSTGAMAFEPVDEYKGDFARNYFYLATRYNTRIASWTSSPMIDGDINDADGSVFEEWALNMLMEWNTNDPVSQKELNRNDAIYAIQGNRNPFIDHPEWIGTIWGGSPSLSLSKTSLTGFAYAEGSGTSDSQSFTLSGTNLDGTSVSITAPTNYEISTDNSSFGASLNINYTAPTLSATTIYVRLKTGLAAGDYNNQILSCNDNGTAVNVTLTTSGSVSEVLDWYNLQWPENGTIAKGNDFNVYAQVYEPGITDATGQGAGITAWIGYSTENTDPSTWTNWIVATYNGDSGNNDEYLANLGILPEGTYYYASKFELNSGGIYFYGGYNGGTWDGTTNVSGVLTIEVTATKLAFRSQPTTVNLGAAINPSVQIAYVDDNGNIDTDYNGAGSEISLTTTGTFDGAATISVAPVNGICTFNNLIFSASATNRTITANKSGFTSVESNSFNINSACANDLIISEYVEGSASNKYIEIANFTNNTIDLSNYELLLYTNGATTPTNTNSLSGSLATGETKVYANSSATIYSGTTTTATAVNFNGDDAIALFKIGSAADEYVDIIGRIGEDPGTAWTSTSNSTANKTLVRKSSVVSGVKSNPTSGFPTLETEWQVYNQDDVSHLGNHALSCETLGWCNLQAPPSGNIEKNQEFLVYSRVFYEGTTEAAGQGAGISAWIGYSTENTNPTTWTNWIEASYNADYGSNDEYKANLGFLPEGTYYYASRFSLDESGAYSYGGYNSSGGNFWDGTDNTSGVLNSTGTKVTTSINVPATTISSLKNTNLEAQNVLRFNVTDPGLDGKKTEITNIRIKPGASNTADWTNTIQGITLNENTVTLQNVTITDTYIDIAIASGNYEIADNNSANEIRLSVYLNTSNIVDGEILSFMIDANDHGFTADANYSQFATNFDADIISSDFTIDVSATNIAFAENKPPSSATINTNFSAKVQAVDANGNLDLDATNSITISKASGAGNLSSVTGLAQSLTNGSYEWSDMQLDAEDTYTINATTSGLTNNSITSGNIIVTSCTPAVDGSGTVSFKNSLTGKLNGTDIWQRNKTSQEIEITITGESTNCLTQFEIDLSPIFDNVDIANISLSGDALTGTETLAENTDNILTISNIQLTNTNTLTISANSLTTKDISDNTDIGNKTIAIKTAASGGTLTNIASQPLSYLTIPFANAKKLSGSVLDNLGETVAIEGVSTIASGRLCSSNFAYDQFFLQEGDGAAATGICIYQTSEFSPVREIAHEYIIKGQLGLVSGTTNNATDAYANMTAIVNPTTILDSGSSTLPTPYVIEIDDSGTNGLYTMSDADFEKVDGLLMRIQSLKKESGTWPTDNTNLANLQLYDNDNTKNLRCFIFANTDIGGNTEPDWASDEVDMVTLVYNYNQTGTGVIDRQITPVYYDNFFKSIVWDNATGNGLWADAQNWSPNVLPQPIDDVVFENTTELTESYDVIFNVASAEVNSLTISPSTGKEITFTIPSSNTSIPALILNSSDNALQIKEGGTFINNSGALSGENIDFAGTSPFLVIENGGKYIHQTSTPNSYLINLLSNVAGTEKGTFEFDVPRDINYAISLSGRTYGNLELSASTNTPVYTVSGSNNLTINNNFILNSGAQFNENSYTGDIIIKGNLTNNATAWTFNPGQTLTFAGTDLQTVSGSFENDFDKNIIIANTTGVEINNLLLVKGTSPNFTINANCKTFINPNSGLTVEGNFVNNGEIHLKSPNNSGASGSLITLQSGASISGTAFAERFIPRNEWHYVSSPITSAQSTLFTTSPNGWNPNFFYYNEMANASSEPTSTDYSNWSLISNAWVKAHNGEAGASETMEIGRGYSAYDNGYKTIIFEGELNNGDINIPVTNTDNDNNGGTNGGYFDGWNLIGNPFPSALDWDNADWDKTYIDNTLYFYEEDHITGEKFYRYYNGAGGTESDVAGISLNSASTTPNIIPAMQGFFVKAKSTAGAGQNVLVPNSARVHSEQIFWKNETKNNLNTNILRLKAEGNNLSDETVIRFIQEATPAHDSKYDAYKMIASSEKRPQLYSLANGIPLAINSLNEATENLTIPLGFLAQTSGNYSITASDILFDSEQNIYLVDNFIKDLNNLSTKVNLKENPSYSFYQEKGESLNRFEIQFGENSALNIKEELQNTVRIFSHKSDVFINILDKNFAQAYVQIYDLLGKQVFEQQINVQGQTVLNTNLKSGLYIVRIENVCQKILIENK